MTRLSKRRDGYNESDEDDYAGTHAPRDSTNLELDRQADRDERGPTNNNYLDEEDYMSENEPLDEEDYQSEDHRAAEEQAPNEEQPTRGEDYPHEEDDAPEEDHPPYDNNASHRDEPGLDEQIRRMVQNMMGRLDYLQARQTLVDQRVDVIAREIGSLGQSSALNDNATGNTNAANATVQANAPEQSNALERIANLLEEIKDQTKAPARVDALQQINSAEQDDEADQVNLPEVMRALLEAEDERDGALEQPNRVSNRESIIAQFRAIAALNPLAQNWLHANLSWPDQGQRQAGGITFTVGLRNPAPGWLGYWAFRSHGEGSSEEMAMTNVAGGNHWPTNNANPSADQVYELRTRLRRLGGADLTHGIDLVWVPTLRTQQQGGANGSQAKSKGHSKNPNAADARKESRPDQVNSNDGRHGSGVRKNLAGQNTNTKGKSIGVDKPVEENERNLIGNWNDERMTRAQRKASEQNAAGLASQQSKYTAASTGTIHPSSRPKPEKSVPRKKPTHGPGKNRPKIPALRAAENERRQKQLIKEAKEIKRQSSNPGPSTRSQSQPDLSHPGAAAESEAAAAAPLKRKRGGKRLVDGAEESGDDQRDTDEGQPKRRSTAPSKKKQKRAVARSQKAVEDLNEGQSDGEEIEVSRPGEQEDQEPEEPEDGQAEDQADDEASRRDDIDAEDEPEVPKKKGKGNNDLGFKFPRFQFRDQR